MKIRHLFIALTACALLGTTAAYAQASNQTVDLHPVESSLPTLDLKGNNTLPAPRTSADNVLWQRDVYRMVDLMLDCNAPLYFPPQPDGNRKNLFSLVFEKVATGELGVYDYLDGKEIFNDAYRVKFTELLNRFWIPYEVRYNVHTPGDSVLVLETADIPSNEVTLYYVKECYYLDQTNSSVKTKVIAFCPVLVREDETGEVRKYPLFWVPFESVRPLLSQTAVSINNNASSRMSVADYLTRRLYKGDIYKVYNLQNRNIMDYCKTPEAIRAEQERLEKELAEIGQSLWPASQAEVLAAEEEAAEAARQQGRPGRRRAAQEQPQAAAPAADQSAGSAQEALNSLPKPVAPPVGQAAAVEEVETVEETEE